MVQPVAADYMATNKADWVVTITFKVPPRDLPPGRFYLLKFLQPFQRARDQVLRHVSPWGIDISCTGLQHSLRSMPFLLRTAAAILNSRCKLKYSCRMRNIPFKFLKAHGSPTRYPLANTLWSVKGPHMSLSSQDACVCCVGSNPASHE